MSSRTKREVIIMTRKENEKEKNELIGEIIANVTTLTKDEARRISDIVFGIKLAKELGQKGA